MPLLQVVARFLISLAVSIARVLFLRRASERASRAGGAPKPAMVVDVEPVKGRRGIDYLLEVMGESAETPFLRAFREMVNAEEGEKYPAVAVADVRRSELKEHELIALAVVGSAAQAAAERGDLAGLRETLQVGLSCALRFEEFLKRSGLNSPDV